MSTSLLDIFLKGNPGRGKTEEEKQADRERYKPGDVVLPKLRRRGERDDDERRMLEDVQAQSLRDVGIPNGSSRSLELPRERRRRERSREGSRESRRSRDERQPTSRNAPGASPERAVIPSRVIEHQSSLRSLLSASDLDSIDVDEDLVRQVLEELMAEGVDLNDIGTAQEEEITERIAEAVRRRQADRQAERHRERRERRERLAREGLTSSSSSSLPPPIRSPLTRDEEASHRRGLVRTGSGTSTPLNVPGPPISRPGLIDAANRGGRLHHQRSSSLGSSRSTRRLERPPTLSTTSARHSDPDLERPSPIRRQSDNQQRSALDARQHFRNSIQTVMASSVPNSPRNSHFEIPNSSPTSSLAVVNSPLLSPSATSTVIPSQPQTLRRTTEPSGTRRPRSFANGTPPLASPPTFSRATTDPAANEIHPRQSAGSVHMPPVLYTEPRISCNSCGKDHIEHELHYNCSRCDDGNYNICLRCYRLRKGCKYWFGFGWNAWQTYEQRTPAGGYPPNHEHPHILIGHRYRRPLVELSQSTNPSRDLMSEEDPKNRLEAGVFCDMCKAYANACYWKCDYCNEGDWGFCNSCVNQGRHCTHPLLPIAHQVPQQKPDVTASAPSTPGLASPDRAMEPTSPPVTPQSASLVRGPDHITIANSIFRPLTFTTLCNVCRYPIPPSHTRYHCLQCNTGDYDMCTGCYHKLVLSSRISKEDGMNGWRKCLRGHRMVIVGFEDRDGGQRRVVVRDLVGGWALKDGDSSAGNMQRLPPDGGEGLKVRARWGYWPDEGVEDELAFPKFAEIREAADVNGDWFWGVYCGAKGLFPANYVVPA
ncbi:hypothetical protein P153DRAFT_369447 [Dothidotthia symphoricarpi CBS 119687]|uniref:SH3 domain-containing protein n=1 Tax=Dothidotthia symphoricarpi CBS 119687 TaxID=1392245 RepID=A0A6A6A4N4_9PLEO|nr:uncharacterized protein P153DRAFT_369447 [Dothidotthia symphoricarpi CBS 119687]KAF2126084.1 hypothetical protein P153DRAFT_369447 [Dothidotthia symphoricarpi CBS 119687]